MGVNQAPLVADHFLICYVRKFTKKLSKSSALHLIEKLNTTFRFNDDIASLPNLHFLTNSNINWRDVQRKNLVNIKKNTQNNTKTRRTPKPYQYVESRTIVPRTNVLTFVPLLIYHPIHSFTHTIVTLDIRSTMFPIPVFTICKVNQPTTKGPFIPK